MTAVILMHPTTVQNAAGAADQAVMRAARERLARLRPLLDEVDALHAEWAELHVDRQMAVRLRDPGGWLAEINDGLAACRRREAEIWDAIATIATTPDSVYAH
jgi:hypothetical protein